MSTVTIHFCGELNDHLPRGRRERVIEYALDRRVSIKDVVESLGVPHPEIAALYANEQPIEFSYLVRPNDAITVYPYALAPADHLPLRPPLLMPPRFVLDTHLGTLASYLRLLGFDTLYRNDYADDVMAQIADEDARMLLTRDRGLLKRGRVLFGYFVRETDPQRQVEELVKRYNLCQLFVPLHRCIRCNGLLQHVEKATIAHLLAPKTRQYYDDFRQCDTCGQIYWKGSHYNRMQAFITTISARCP